MTQSVDAQAIASNISAQETAEQPPQENVSRETPEEESQQPTIDNKQNDDFVRRFNELSRREREFVERQKQFKDQYGQYQEYEKERSLIKDDPISFLEKHGWKFQDLADHVLNDNRKTPDRQVSELQKRIDQMEAERKREIEEKERLEKENKNRETVNAFKTKIKDEVSSNNEQFELINHFGEYDTVYDVIEKYYHNTGQILDTTKAAQEVEKFLESQFEKAATTNKIKKRFNLSFEEAVKENATAEAQKQSEPSTLTNEMVSSSNLTTSEPQKTYLSEEESKARSAQIIKDYFLKKQGYNRN